MSTINRVKTRLRSPRYALGNYLLRSLPEKLVPKHKVLGTDIPTDAVYPNFLGIGFPRCGTTTISYHLAQHPEISFPTDVRKELHFFDYNRSMSWYIRQFQANVAVGEFTPRYITVPSSRDRIYDMLGPDIQMIVGLRNPVDRAYSHYWQKEHGDNIDKKLHHLVNGEPQILTFERVLELESHHQGDANFPEEMAFFQHGLYAQHLDWYFQKFTRENFFIYLMEEFAEDPRGILAQLCDFLGVDSTYEFQEIGIRRAAHTESPMAPETRQELTERYQPSIKELESLLDRRFSIWQ